MTGARFRSALGAIALLSSISVASGQEAPVESVEPGSIRLQPGDPVAEPLEPIHERTEKTDQQLDAMSWFGVAKLRESRGDFRGALDAYRKAIEIDPKAVAVYRGLVPLAFSLNETDEGLKYALKLVELDPGDAGLMQQLARVLVSRGQVAQAADLLEKAVAAETVKKKSAQYVSLQRDLGVLYAAQGDNEKAAKAFEVLLAALKDPEAYGLDARQRSALVADAETTYERLGQTFLDAGKTDLAVEAFEKAAESRRGKTGILQYNLARVYLKAGDLQKSLEQLDAYIEARRTDRGRAAYDLLVEVLTALQREGEITNRLQAIVEKDDKNAYVKLVLADQYAKADNLDEAAKLYESTVDEVKDAAGYLGLADVYRRQKRADRLVEFLARGAVAGASDQSLLEAIAHVTEDTTLTDEVVASGRAKAEAAPPTIDFASAYLLGKLSVQAERYDDADLFYRSAIRIRPDRAAALYEEYGRQLLLADRYEAAVNLYRDALDAPADDATKLNFMFRLSQAQEFLGKTDEALATVDQALTIAPDAPLLHYQKGWVHFHAQHWDEAAKLFEQVIEQFPQDADTVRQARLSLSALYVEQGEKRKGEQVLEEIYATDPDDPSINNDLGYLYADANRNLEQAESMIRKALASEPENAAYLDSMGWVLYRLGKFDEAATHLEKAVGLPSGNDSTLWDHLGDVYSKLDKAEKAKDAWKKALELAKEDKTAKPDEIKAIEDKLNDGSNDTSPTDE